MMKDRQGFEVQVFALEEGKTIATLGYSPETNEVVKLGLDVVITLDSIALEYLAGSAIALMKGKTYYMSIDTPVHVMG